MVTVGRAESQIKRTEGFCAKFIGQDGHDIRSDKGAGTGVGVPAYPYEKAAWGNWTVKRWIQERFKRAYPGYECHVENKSGDVANGNVLLETVRRSYSS